MRILLESSTSLWQGMDRFKNIKQGGGIDKKHIMRSFHRIKRNVGLKVLEEHNYKCIKCNSEINLCVHHIVPMDVKDKRYNDISNLTVLCRSCHMKHHRKEGDIKPPVTPAGNPYGRRGKIDPIICKIEGCGKMQHARSLCKKHYEYKRIKGILI